MILSFYQFAPELILVSAGFDAAHGDPLVWYTLVPKPLILCMLWTVTFLLHNKSLKIIIIIANKIILPIIALLV